MEVENEWIWNHEIESTESTECEQVERKKFCFYSNEFTIIRYIA